MLDLVPHLPLAEAATVRHLTSLLPDEGLAERWPRMQAFLAEAQAPAEVGVPTLLATLQDMWRVPWDNCHKEPFWRLAVGGLQIFGDARFMRGRPALACPCGHGRVGRLHCFWDCCVSQAVRATVQAALDAAFPAGGSVLRHHLWVSLPPVGVHGGVWLVVTLAALAAMNTGRRHLAGMCIPDPADVEPMDVPANRGAYVPATQPQLLRACVCAEETFWALMHDFVLVARDTPRRWRDLYGSVPASHPFLHGRAQGVLAVSQRPAQVALAAVPPPPLALPAP